MNRMVNRIQLARKLACMLRTYKTCNLMGEFSKYEFNNKIIDGITLLKVYLITFYQITIS